MTTEFKSIIGIAGAALIGAIILAIVLHKSSMTEIITEYPDTEQVAWVSELIAFKDFNSQTVSRITLGLRKDGVVVWQEDRLTGITSSLIFKYAPARVVGSK